MFIYHRILLCCFILIFFNTSHGQVHDPSWRRIINKQDKEWFASDEAQTIADNVLLYQRDIGGWPKNTQMQKLLSPEEKEKLKALKQSTDDVTTDNGATIQELLFLSKMYRATKNATYKEAWIKGLHYIFEAQYENGGWPQFYPLRKGYYSHITYNDNSMVNILKLLQQVKNKTDYYAVPVSDADVKRAEEAFNKGIECIVKTQYKQNGALTAWCAQHDVKTLAPAKARSYELPSLSGAESAEIVWLLMSIENPSEAVKNAIVHAVSWFKKVKIEGLKVERKFDETIQKRNTIVVEDDDATPVWARFMELDDNTPFFCDRDGIKKATLAEIGYERRNGYAWYTQNPQKVIDKFPEWKAKHYEKPSKKVKDAYNVTVAKDGSGDYTSIQEAIYASKAFPYQRVIINIKDGVYNEKVHVFSWNTHVSFLGESKENTIITFDDYFSKIDLGRNSTFLTSTVLIEGDYFLAKNLTIQNTAGPVGQAVALSVNANNCFFENCNLKGYQDTVYTAGEGFKQYFKNCFIEGSTDFIFGEATVLFDDCVINNKTNSYITAASTAKNETFGYVFKNCKLTADVGVNEVYLGRPWRKYAKTVFINCDMGNHILPVGWHNWKNKEAESTSFYAEYNNTGIGFKPNERVSWSHQLAKKQAKKYTINNILGNQFFENLNQHD
ncbi:pectate lyase [Neotamlana nanhaiensis]|uniref:pectate lyase n=1 Tax=Neotamlana nanhaiensis TaxID=1382798 RepID=UPI0005CC27DA|nr:pectate lyase [Tamlana nanhaiensis]